MYTVHCVIAMHMYAYCAPQKKKKKKKKYIYIIKKVKKINLKKIEKNEEKI